MHSVSFAHHFMALVGHPRASCTETRPAAARVRVSSTRHDDGSMRRSAYTLTSGSQRVYRAWRARQRCSTRAVHVAHGSSLYIVPRMQRCPALQVVGTLLPGPAEALGLSTDVVVSAGSGDNACSALGVGAVKHGALKAQ